jgi:hypothetical protein
MGMIDYVWFEFLALGVVWYFVLKNRTGKQFLK